MTRSFQNSFNASYIRIQFITFELTIFRFFNLCHFHFLNFEPKVPDKTVMQELGDFNWLLFFSALQSNL